MRISPDQNPGTRLSFPFRIILVILLILSAPQARAGLTLVTRETFQGIGTLTSGTPGNLGTVSNSFYKRPGGPRLTSDTTANSYGWSADLRSTACATQSLTGLDYHMVSQWVYLAKNPWSTAGHYTCILRTQVIPAHGYHFLTIMLLSNGNFGYLSLPTYTLVDSGIAFPFDTFVELRVAWRLISGGTYQKGAYFRVAGASTFTALDEEASATNNFNDGLGNVTFGLFTDGNSPSGPGRVGMPSIYSMTAWSDRLTLISDVVDPASTPHNWFCNASTGNDANDGTTAATAWASVAQVNTESQWLGMFPSLSGMGNGDTLTINGSATPLDLGGNALQIQTQALKVVLVGAEPIKLWKDVSSASTTWTLAGGSAKTYTTTDGAAADLTGVVIWENDKWLNHPTGSNFAAVQSTMDTTPGSFFSDGTNLYLHPFGDTNPASDGKTYTRSRYRTANSSSGGSAILVQAADVWIAGDAAAGTVFNYTDRLGAAQSFRVSKAWKTCLARSTDNDPYGGYAVQWDSGSGGSCKITNVLADYFSKHGMGRTASASNLLVTRQNVAYGQGTPYVAFGGQTQDVDYCDTGTGNSFAYINCASVVNVGVIGSAAGVAYSSQQSWIEHTGTTVFAFSGGSWLNCALCSVLADGGGVVGPLTITGSSFGGGYVNCTTSMDQCKTTQQPMTVQTAGKTLTITNSVIGITDTTTNYFWSQLTGSLVLRGVAVDLRGNASGNTKSAWSKLTSASVTAQNVVFLSDPGKDFSLLDNFAPGDTISMDHNAYQLGPSGWVVQRWNGGAIGTGQTLAQWQALGYGTASFATTNPMLDAGYLPLAGSPLLSAGVDVGPLGDYTGRVRLHRPTIGALEPALPPRTLNLAAVRAALGL